MASDPASESAKGPAQTPGADSDVFALLVKDMRIFGPVRGDWANYGKLGNGRHHCHIKKGHPTYIAVWQEVDDTIQLIEVTFVGTHEKAPS